MSKRRQRQWYRLENASKIFPANSNGRDSNVFRFACELREDVDPDILQAALDDTLTQFPFYRSILRRGFFWMYFEQSNLKARVHPENRPPCSRIFNPDVKSLLFDVSYYNKRINLEVFHALSDGAGAMHFLQQILWAYLAKKYGGTDDIEPLHYDASQFQRAEDSFNRHYRHDRPPKSRSKRIVAHTEKHSYLPQSRIQVLSAYTSLKDSLTVSKKYGVSLTVYLSAVLLEAYNESMTWKDRKRPVVLAVPVNLRRFFKSETTRNFFALVYVRYHFRNEEEDFSGILQSVREQFKEKVTAEHLTARIHRLVRVEHNPFVRGIPLFLKNPGLRIANYFVQKESTTTLSNLGQIELPTFCAEHVLGFQVYVGTERTQLTLCSYQDQLSLNFSTSFADLEVQRAFFRRLAADGLTLCLSTSEADSKEQDK